MALPHDQMPRRADRWRAACLDPNRLTRSARKTKRRTEHVAAADSVLYMYVLWSADRPSQFPGHAGQSR
eukprot:3883954-Prymnesium_polylepis.1